MEELDKFKKEPVSAEELQKAKNQILRGLAAKAIALRHCSAVWDRPEMLAEYGAFLETLP